MPFERKKLRAKKEIVFVENHDSIIIVVYHNNTLTKYARVSC